MLRLVDVYDADAVSSETALSCSEESRTRQEFKAECDINTIIDRFGIGENPIESHQWVTDVDIENAPSNYQDVMNQLNVARDQFMSLPARLRGRFNNDPHEFVSFVSDSKNLDEMVQLGLAVPRPAVVPSDTDRLVDAIKGAKNGPAQSSS